MNTIEKDNTDFNQPARSLAVKYGLIWAGINLFLFLVIYYAFPSILGSWKQSALQLVVGIGLAIYFTLTIRKEIGGFWTYREAISSIFILFIIPSLVLFFFSIVFGKFIEPGYAGKIKESVLNSTTELLENISQDQELIDKTIEETEVALEKQLNPSAGDVVKTLGISILVYFLMALVWAAIFKRDRPVFLNPKDYPSDPEE